MTLTLCLTNDVAGDAYGDIMCVLLSTPEESLTEVLKELIPKLPKSLGVSDSDIKGAVEKLSLGLRRVVEVSPGWLWLSAHTTPRTRKEIEILWNVG